MSEGNNSQGKYYAITHRLILYIDLLIWELISYYESSDFKVVVNTFLAVEVTKCNTEFGIFLRNCLYASNKCLQSNKYKHQSSCNPITILCLDIFHDFVCCVVASLSDTDNHSSLWALIHSLLFFKEFISIVETRIGLYDIGYGEHNASKYL